MALLFPAVVFRNRFTTSTFILLPFAYVGVVKLVMPELSALAGWPLPEEGYAANVLFDEILTLRLPASAYYQTVANILENAWLITLDTFGLINPTIPESQTYNLLFFVLVLCIGAFAGRLVWQEWRRRFPKQHPGSPTFQRTYRQPSTGVGSVQDRPAEPPESGVPPKYTGGPYQLLPNFGRWRARLVNSPPLVRALVLLALVFIYEGILMTISIGTIIPRWWGLYYYGVFCVIFLLICVAQLLERSPPPIVLQIVFALAVITATTFIFPATNRAYKTAHYYTDRLPLDLVFTNAINRFKIPAPSADYLYKKTLALWHIRETHENVTDVPVELTYVLYELGLTKINTPCEYRTRYFDVIFEPDPVWHDPTPTVHCRDALQPPTPPSR
jgi:hypothetical protein